MSPFLQMLDRPLNNACHSSLLCAPVESIFEKHAPLENFEIQCFHLEHIKFATDITILHSMMYIRLWWDLRIFRRKQCDANDHDDP